MTSKERSGLAGRRPSVLSRSVFATVRAVAVWTAVVVPLLYLPLLVTGLNTGPTQVAFAALVALNAASIAVGHRYRAD